MGDILLSVYGSRNDQESHSRYGNTTVIHTLRIVFSSLFHSTQNRIQTLDYRFVLLGSLLPDIIDKPVFLLFGNTASLSGRDYAHSLLFNLILIIGGILLSRRGKPWLLSLSIASFIHLIFDQIWNNPVTLFWPLLGKLSSGKTTEWMAEVWYGLFSPGVIIPELAGLVILFLFMYVLYKGGNTVSFIRMGNTG